MYIIDFIINFILDYFIAFIEINKLPFELFISFLAVIIAGISLFYSINQTINNNLHNRLSVKPYLNKVYGYETDQHRSSLTIINAGIGPAFIYKLNARSNNINYDLLNLDSLIELKALCPMTLGHTSLTYRFCLPAGDSVNIFQSLTDIPVSDVSIIHNFYSSIDLYIEYKSIYDDLFYSPPK
jgi:hypothetical protein